MSCRNHEFVEQFANSLLARVSRPQECPLIQAGLEPPVSLPVVFISKATSKLLGGAPWRDTVQSSIPGLPATDARGDALLLSRRGMWPGPWMLTSQGPVWAWVVACGENVSLPSFQKCTEGLIQLQPGLFGASSQFF